MNNKYEITATAIKQAEEAFTTLKEFSETQYKAKGETMLEQITDYIAHTLSDANYIYSGCSYGHIALSNMSDHAVFLIYDHSTISSGTPIFSITYDGKIKNYRELSAWMMLTLVETWDGFKKELNIGIEKALERRIKHINKQLSHIGYVNEQLSKWHV